MFDWYDGSNDYEGALLRTESEPPVFGDEGQMEEEDMSVISERVNGIRIHRLHRISGRGRTDSRGRD